MPFPVNPASSIKQPEQLHADPRGAKDPSSSNARRICLAVVAGLALLSIRAGDARAADDFTITPLNVVTPYLKTGDTNASGGNPTAADVLLALRCAVGLEESWPLADIDKNGVVTTTDALLVLRLSVGFPLPVGILDPAEFRAEIIRWMLNNQNALGLIGHIPGFSTAAATYDEGVAGLAELSLLRYMLRGFDREDAFNAEQMIASVAAVLDFYLGKYEQGGFNGFAEFYDITTGQPDYTIGGGGNLAGPNAYVMVLAAQYVGLLADRVDVAYSNRLLTMAVGIARWLKTLARSDGGLEYGTIGNSARKFGFASTGQNLSAREALIGTAELFELLSDFEPRDELYDLAVDITGFLEAVAWDAGKAAYSAGVDDEGQADPRIFTDVCALAGMSQFSLPGDADKRLFLVSADSILRGRHPWDLEPSVSIDGYGSFDDSGIQNEWSLEMSMAYNMLASGYPSTASEGKNLWRWAAIITTIAKARIDEADGSGIAQAATAHNSGFGFAWDSHEISVAASAWLVMAFDDFHFGVAMTDGLAVYAAVPPKNGVRARDDGDESRMKLAAGAVRKPRGHHRPR